MTARMKTGIKQANGSLAVEPTMNVENVAKAVRLHGVPATRRERSVHDGDGDEDALHRPRLSSPNSVTMRGTKRWA